jgi:hypothetical protein
MDANLLSNFNFLKMANTKYLVSRQTVEHPSLTQVFSGNGSNVYKFNDYSPRASIVGNHVISATDEETFEIIQSPGFNPDSTVILHKDGEYLGGGRGTVEIISWEPQNYTMNVQMQGDGFLVLSEAWYPPGWRASLDGEEVPLLQANHTFQAIEVPNGVHQVIVDFSSTTFSRGLALSRGLFYLMIALLIGNSLYVNREFIREKIRRS